MTLYFSEADFHKESSIYSIHMDSGGSDGGRGDLKIYHSYVNCPVFEE